MKYHEYYLKAIFVLPFLLGERGAGTATGQGIRGHFMMKEGTVRELRGHKRGTRECRSSFDCPDTAELRKWNRRSFLNNCYAYAMNKKTDDYAQPGHASGLRRMKKKEISCYEVSIRAVHDGVVSLGPYSHDCPSNTCLTALYVAEDHDFHWYRKNKDGTWSSKMAMGRATVEYYARGNEIGSRLMRGGGWRFCEYMCTTCNLRIAGRGSPRGRAVGTELDKVEEDRFYDIQIVSRSGVPNPGWFLEDEKQIEFIRSAVNREDLEPATDPHWPSLVGYRGFGIIGRTDLGLPPVVRVWNGTMEIQGASDVRYFLDDVGLEDYLINQTEVRGLGYEI